ncbi:MAG: diguanylate cyclase [Lachnospiraceae bacterium]|nr:diguanylate cyclase [Lachnospiraceae bacterium]
MKKLTRSSRYMISISVFLVVINALLGFLLTKQSDYALRDLIHHRMLDISNTAAAMINGDVLESASADNMDSPECREIYETLTYFQDNIELEYIYCIREVAEGSFVFSIDPTVDDPGEFGEPIVCTEALMKASDGVAAVDEEPYEDKWGRFYSSYSPVFDSEGNVAGIVAVDFSADWYDKQITGLVTITAVVIIIAFAISVGIIMFIATKYRKRFNTISKDMRKLSDDVETLVKEVSIDSYWYEETPKTGKEKTSNDEIEVISIKLRSLHDRLEEQIDYVRSLAFVDALTGLENRNSYMEQIKVIEENISSGKASFTVVVCDVNQLKIINDDYGHEEGDKVLTLISRTIQELFSSEKIYRIGGDEFVIIGKDPDYSGRISDLKTKIKSLRSEIDDLPASVSAGFSVFDEEKDKEYSDVFNRADKLMYEDKKKFYQTHEDRRKAR